LKIIYQKIKEAIWIKIKNKQLNETIYFIFAINLVCFEDINRTNHKILVKSLFYKNICFLIHECTVFLHSINNLINIIVFV
jgi:hypothetical protein